MDTEYQAGRSGLQKAYDKGIGVVIMEPIRGGWLAQKPPQSAKELFESENADRSPVEWALHWIWSQKEPGVVLSGMSNLQQLKENLKTASESEIGLLSQSEFEMMEKAAEEMRGPITCTRCEYCGLSTLFKTIFYRTLNIYIQQVLGNLTTHEFCGYYTS